MGTIPGLAPILPEDVHEVDFQMYHDERMMNIGELFRRINDPELIPYYTVTDLVDIEETANYLFSRIIEVNKIPENTYKINVQEISSDFFKQLISLKGYVNTHKELKYPPEYVFPRNPNLSQFITPQTVSEETYLDDGSGLSFELGFTGTLNVIRTKYPVYLDRKYYDFKQKKWTQPQFTIMLRKNKNTDPQINNFVDITPYYTNSLINFSGQATGINDTISYYFDGEKFVTNYNFTNVDERKQVIVTYKKLLNSLRVKAVLRTNMSGLSYYTPVVDQFTLLVDKQRVLS